MSRIRSVHPGQWTDEDFVGCSFAARLLAIGLRNEADDNGIFEWKPMGLKMRLFPADSVDVAELLAELAASSQVCEFEADGRRYGAIRNFRVYQSPRSPKAIHPCPAHLADFIGAAAEPESDASDVKKRGPGRPRKSRDAGINSVEGKSFPQNVEINSEREREREKELIVGGDACANARDAEPPPPAPRDLIQLTDEICRTAGIRHVEPGPILRHQQLVRSWLDEGFDPETDILPGIRAGIATATERINSLRFFDRDIRQTKARREAGHEHAGTEQPVNPILAAVLARRGGADRAGGDDHPVRLLGGAGAGGG